jgi:hypothetical protein
MDHQHLRDGMAKFLAAGLIVMSLADLLLFPDRDRQVVSLANFAFCGSILLFGGNGQSDWRSREWKRVAVAAWLVSSPWLLGFQDMTATLWTSLLFAILLFVPAASAVGQPEEPVRAFARAAAWRNRR